MGYNIAKVSCGVCPGSLILPTQCKLGVTEYPITSLHCPNPYPAGLQETAGLERLKQNIEGGERIDSSCQSYKIKICVMEIGTTAAGRFWFDQGSAAFYSTIK